MKKYWPIIKDAIILLVISTAFVTLCNGIFRGLKKTTESDLLVTAINQENAKGVQEIFAEAALNKEFKSNNRSTTTLSEFKKIRANRIDDNGRTPIMWLAYVNLDDKKKITDADSKRVPLLETILASSTPDINARDHDGWSALMWASWSGLTSLSGKLIEKGADVKLSDRKGNTALSIAAKRGNTEIVNLLRSQGA
ncbi:MAG: ankyrin repeat domain-containing protein [Oligoflexia bacterium]|nr:ankyrin repeat domain-containing protein [Oligoflexia bacterium]MBF0366566.1 ankyrin repeat domain-containing protein [Oligoflexia bacterium]